MPAVFVDSFGGMDYPRFRAADSVFMFLRGYDGDTSSFASGTSIIEFELSNTSDYAASRVLMTIEHGGEINVRWYNSISEIEIVLTATYSARTPHNIGFWADDTGSYLLLDGDQVATGGALTYLGGLWDKTKVLVRKEAVTPAVDRFRVAHIQTVAAYSGLTLAEAQALTVEGDEPTSPRYPATLPAVLRNTKSRNQPAPYRVMMPRRSQGYTQEIGSDTPVFWDVQWRFNRAQAYEFIQWLENDLKRGALPFVMSLKTEFGMIEHACRFLPDSLLPASDTGETWDYSASIMSRGEIIPPIFIDNADAIIAAENWNGTIPGDPYWSNVARLVQFGDATTGAAFRDWKTDEAGALFTDGASVEGLVTRTTTQQLGTAPSMRWTYQASASFANRILTFPASAAHAIPSGQDFTVEAWIRGTRATTDGQGWITIMRSHVTNVAANAADWEFVLQAGSAGPGGVNSFLPGFVINNEILIRADNLVGVNNAQWHHVAVSRQGSSWRVFVNGVSASVVTPQGSPGGFTGSFGSASSQLSLMGRRDNNGGGLPNCYGFGQGAGTGADDAYDGYLGAARLTVGAARYWANFTPVAEPFASNAEIVIP